MLTILFLFSFAFLSSKCDEGSLYLDPLYGSDNENCTVSSLPCLTLDRVLFVAVDERYQNYGIQLLNDLIVDKEYQVKFVVSLRGNGHSITFNGMGSFVFNGSFHMSNGFMIEKAIIYDKSETRITIISIPSRKGSLSLISYCTVHLTKSGIKALHFEDSTFIIQGSGFLYQEEIMSQISHIRNCTFIGENMEDKTTVFPNGAIMTDNMKFIDFLIYFDKSDDVFYQVSISDGNFLYTEKYTLDYGFYLSNTSATIGTSVTGYQKMSGSTSLLVAKNKAKVYFEAGTVSNIVSDNLFTVTGGSNLHVMSAYLTDIQVVNSLFLVHDEDSKLTIMGSNVKKSSGRTVFDLSNSQGIEDQQNGYDQMNDFEDFFTCDSNATEQSTLFDWSTKTSTIKPYINNVDCSGVNCKVQDFSTCNDFYLEYEDPEKKKHDDGNGTDTGGGKDWRDWGIPLIAGGGVCLIFCVFCVLFIIACLFFTIVICAGLGGTGMICPKRKSNYKYESINDDGDGLDGLYDLD